jgi:hypothetical protein
MKLLFAVIGTTGLGSTILVLVILARLTQRWELVTRTKSYYRLFYVSAGLVALASLTRLIRTGYLTSEVERSIFGEPTSWFYLYFYHAPLIVGMVVSLVVTWRNWGWLLRAQSG